MSDDLSDPRARTILEAIRKRTALLVTYNDEVRPMEPHAIGQTRRGDLVVRCWQVAGGSRSQGPVPGWRLLRLDRIAGMEPMDSPSLAPRPLYNPEGDHAMTRILAKV